ncbi:MAG: hypothetical protein RIF33_15045 [Cyclobacteriaceae bacterium]
MKKRFNIIWSLCAIAGLGLLASCGDEDTETPAPSAPTLTVSANGGTMAGTADITAVPGDVISFSWSAATPGGFNVLRVSGLNPILEEDRNDLGLEAGAVSASGSFDVTVTEDLVGSVVTLDFLLVDDENLQDSETWTITVEAPPSPAARAYTTVLLSAPLGDLSAESFFSSSTGLTYSPTAVTSTSDPISATIDFGYYYGSTENASLASPAQYAEVGGGVFSPQVAGWTVSNATAFRTTTLSNEDFIAISTFADIDVIYDAGTDDGGVVSNLSENQVIAFETDASKDGGSKRGIVWVKSITPGDGVNGQIEIEVLVQEDAN